MKLSKFIIRIQIAFLLTLLIASVSEAGIIPRFVSLKGGETNLRTGPSKNYPIKWVIKNKGEPVEIVAEFEQWREIRDMDGDSGWVHEAMLSGSRSIIVIGDGPQLVFKNVSMDKKLVRVEPKVRAKLLTCKELACYISVDEYKGWIARKSIWGIYPNEYLDKK